MPRPVNVDQLQSNIAWAVARGLGANDLIPMLRRLIAHAARGSECRLLAQQQLAELLIERQPWQAARLAKEVLAFRDDHRLWGVLGLSFTLLGHHRAARNAYYQALCRAPQCASYAHNLGHLIDVVFERPKEALHWLELAHRTLPDEHEIAASLAHALLRSGREKEARQVLARSLDSEEQADGLLRRWRERAAGAAAGSAREQPSVLDVTERQQRG